MGWLDEVMEGIPEADAGGAAADTAAAAAKPEEKTALHDYDDDFIKRYGSKK
jgi:hypothetical protein